MGSIKLVITPKTKVGELLEAYPGLEPVLMEMSPSFEKLRNPILRKTVARVATLSQIAIVGGLAVDEIVKRLRKEAGQETDEPIKANAEYLMSAPPDWFNESRVTEIYDATPVINAGESPMAAIISKASLLKKGEILEIHTPFTPAPVIDKLREKGFKVFSACENEIHKTRITL